MRKFGNQRKSIEIDDLLKAKKRRKPAKIMGRAGCGSRNLAIIGSVSLFPLKPWLTNISMHFGEAHKVEIS